MIRLYCFLLFYAFGSLAFGQKITGTVVDKVGLEAIIGAEVSILGTDFIDYTNSLGNFSLDVGPISNPILQITHEDFSTQEMALSYNNEDLTLGVIPLEIKIPNEAEDSGNDLFAILSLEDLQEGESESDVSSLLTASDDPFYRMASFNFNIISYTPRGYLSERPLVYLNGLKFNDIEDGSVYWGTWGGLNDVFRNQDVQDGLLISQFSNGGLTGSDGIDLRASSQRKQLRVTFNKLNTNYRNRVMVNYNTGQTESGWSLSICGSKRWAESGFIEGTYYDAYGYFIGVSKRMNSNHSLHFNFLGSHSRRGRASATTQEVYDLLDNNYYNPNWGYQGGKVRNAREYRTHQPIGIIRHDWNINNNTTVTTSLAYQTGYNASTGLDWFEAADPRPDYYRRLPSFYDEDENLSNSLSEYYSNNPDAMQIDWDHLIEINKNRNVSFSGIGNLPIDLPEGNLSAYTIQEQHFDQNKMAFQTHINKVVNPYFKINGGVQFTYDQNKSFIILDDLLGGDYSIDIDKFAIRDFPDDIISIQNDALNPNRIIYEGDRYGWDYVIHNQQAEAWLSAEYSLKKIDLMAAVTGNLTRFWREGNVVTGRFLENSFGDGEVQNFPGYQFKAGATYKINGRNYPYVIGVHKVQSPYSRNAYTSPRSRHDVVANLKTSKSTGVEFGYVFRYPFLNARISGFYTKVTDQQEARNFFNDEFRNFVNFILSDIDTKHMGIELGAEYKLSSTFSLSTGITLGKYQYTNRPSITITQDNNAEVLVEDRLTYLKNFNIDGMPDVAGSLQLEYRSPQYWSANISANFFDGRFVSVNPNRRTELAVDGIVKEEELEQWNSILQQEEFDPVLTFDLFARKSFKLKNGYFIYALVSVNNLLDKRDVAKYGYEQLRYDFENSDPQTFPTRLSYSFGRTFNIGLTFKM